MRLFGKQIILNSYSLNITTTIAFKYPISNWDLIWNNISQFRIPKERLILFKFMHKILPTGDYYHKIKNFQKYSSLCRLLVRPKFSKTHF